VLALAASLAGFGAAAQAEQSAAEIAAELSNPTNALGSLSNNFNFTGYSGDLPGASDQSGWNYLFQPSLPFPQKSGKNLLFRPAIPLLIQQPVQSSGGMGWTDKTELGDISFDLAYGGTDPESGLLTLFGLVATLPTATDDSVGADQWQLGPEFAIGWVKPWGVAGVLITHKWDVAGNDEFRTNITGGQYFYAFPFGDGSWQFAAGPSWSYNHELVGEKWSLPIGVGVSKTLQIGNVPIKLAVQYWDYVKSPDAFGEDKLFRFTITPVIKLPWGD